MVRTCILRLIQLEKIALMHSSSCPFIEKTGLIRRTLKILYGIYRKITLISLSGESDNFLSKTLTCTCTLQIYMIYYYIVRTHKGPVRIRVRIGPQDLWGTDRGTIKIPPCSKAISAEHRPKLCGTYSYR